MSYQEALDFLFSQFPSYQKIGKKAYKSDLSNIIKLCEIFENPHNNQNFIHIGGTNGKGSTAHFTSSVLQEHGLKVGLYTSPHIKDFRERIKINGDFIKKEFIIQFIKKIKSILNTIQPSFFEITFVMALYFFKKEKTDVNIIEVGLGGRLDSTNIINPKVCAITNISLDHINILGNSIEKIAIEKGGIIKPKTPICLGKMNFKEKKILESIAKEKQSPLFFSKKYQGKIPFFESHQQDNAGLSKKIIETYLPNYNKEKLHSGLKNIFINTNLIGRGQVIQKNPTIIFDAAHNIDGVKNLIKEVLKLNHDSTHAIFGASGDKNIESILKEIPKNWHITLSTFSNNRSVEIQDLKNIAKKMNLIFEYTNNPTKKLNYLKSIVNSNDLILVFGSFFLLEEFF